MALTANSLKVWPLRALPGTDLSEILHCPPPASLPYIPDIRQIVKSARDILKSSVSETLKNFTPYFSQHQLPLGVKAPKYLEFPSRGRRPGSSRQSFIRGNRRLRREWRHITCLREGKSVRVFLTRASPFVTAFWRTTIMAKQQSTATISPLFYWCLICVLQSNLKRSTLVFNLDDCRLS